jgi:hypothetical protein
VEDKKVVIIIDDAAQIEKLAGGIVAIIGKCQGYSAVIIAAEAFSAVDLLPTSVFFVGCGEPEPLSFHYIETFFKHINLTGRSCGLFSSSGKGIKYLSELVDNSEATIGKPFLAKDSVGDNEEFHDWIQGVLQRGK